MSATRKELDENYDAARCVFRDASKAYTKAVTAYHARTIGDAEYLLARKAFFAARDAADAVNALPVESTWGQQYVGEREHSDL